MSQRQGIPPTVFLSIIGLALIVVGAAWYVFLPASAITPPTTTTITVVNDGTATTMTVQPTTITVTSTTRIVEPTTETFTLTFVTKVGETIVTSTTLVPQPTTTTVTKTVKETITATSTATQTQATTATETVTSTAFQTNTISLPSEVTLTKTVTTEKVVPIVITADNTVTVIPSTTTVVTTTLVYTTTYTTATFTNYQYSGNDLLISVVEMAGWKKDESSSAKWGSYTPIPGKPIANAVVQLSPGPPPPEPTYVISRGGKYLAPSITWTVWATSSSEAQIQPLLQTVSPPQPLSLITDSTGKVILRGITMIKGYIYYPAGYPVAGEPARYEDVYPSIDIRVIHPNGTSYQSGVSIIAPGLTEKTVIFGYDAEDNPAYVAQKEWWASQSTTSISEAAPSIVLIAVGVVLTISPIFILGKSQRSRFRRVA